MRIVLLLIVLSLTACTPPDPVVSEESAETVLRATIPSELLRGEQAFESNCVACHGTRGLGTGSGPPLVHIVYESAHHADIAFVMAIERGVRAHHWGFGDMPPVPGLERDDVLAIISYIRYLQRQVGIT